MSELADSHVTISFCQDPRATHYEAAWAGISKDARNAAVHMLDARRRNSQGLGPASHNGVALDARAWISDPRMRASMTYRSVSGDRGWLNAFLHSGYQRVTYLMGCSR